MSKEERGRVSMSDDPYKAPQAKPAAANRTFVLLRLAAILVLFWLIEALILADDWRKQILVIVAAGPMAAGLWYSSSLFKHRESKEERDEYR